MYLQAFIEIPIKTSIFSTEIDKILMFPFACNLWNGILIQSVMRGSESPSKFDTYLVRIYNLESVSMNHDTKIMLSIVQCHSSTCTKKIEYFVNTPPVDLTPGGLQSIPHPSMPLYSYARSRSVSIAMSLSCGAATAEHETSPN